jgi:hypothetical protein
MLLQATILTAESKKAAQIQPLSCLVSDHAIAVPSQIGITATLYIGGLIAANHNLRLESGNTSVVIGCCAQLNHSGQGRASLFYDCALLPSKSLQQFVTLCPLLGTIRLLLFFTINKFLGDAPSKDESQGMME